MIAIKRILVVTSFAFVGLVIYLWGHFDGREGQSLIERSFAAETPEVSPTRAREREANHASDESKPVLTIPTN